MRITKYNDHGDNASERTTTVMNPEAGRQYTVSEAGTMIPVGQPQAPSPPAVYETQYTYQYDAYGNWTELTTAAALTWRTVCTGLCPSPQADLLLNVRSVQRERFGIVDDRSPEHSQPKNCPVKRRVGYEETAP